jgi:GT2 family glycosyltransferase
VAEKPAPVSIVVPTVDRPAELARCLDALTKGTVAPAEVIVVDQAGGAATAEAVARYGGEHEVSHVVTDARGLSAARNTGIRQASHEWLAFTDDDCVPDVDWVSSIAARVGAAQGLDGLGGRVLPLGEPTAGTYTLSLRLSRQPKLVQGRAYAWQVGSGGNMALRRSVLTAVGGYDERLGAGSPGLAGEDLELVHRLLRAGASLAFDPSVIVYHDRVSAERRLSTRFSYGYGMGTYVGLWMRRDPWVCQSLARWMADRVVATGRAAYAHDHWRLREQRLMTTGAAAGLRHGWALRDPVDRPLSGGMP